MFSAVSLIIFLCSTYSQNDIPSALDAYLGGAPWDRLEAYRKSSPMTYIINVETPTLILHAKADARDPPSQAKEYYVALKKMGKIIEWEFYPGEPHGLREPKHQRNKITRELAWFDKYILEKEETKEKKEENKLS